MTRELVERAMHGDREAFGALASARLARLVGTAGLMLHGRDVADDVVQEALVRSWRDLPTLRDPDRFDGWLSRILVRTCQDELRRRRPATPLTDEVDRRSSSDPADAVVQRHAISDGLARLTPDQRVVLVMRYYLDQTLEEIAETLGLPIGTVKSRIHRALDAMQAALDADARPPARQERMA